MKLKSFLTLLIFCIFTLNCQIAKGQKAYIITGNVISSVKKNSISNAKVELLIRNAVVQTVTTNEDGYFTIKIGKLEAFQVVVSLNNFYTYTSSITEFIPSKYTYDLGTITLSELIIQDQKAKKKDSKKDTFWHPTVVNWSYISPHQIEIKSTGQEKDVLPSKLLESRILPNKATRQLIHVLNKNMLGDQTIKTGTVIKLPEFPEIIEEQKKQFDKQYYRDMTVDEKQNAVFIDRIGYFNKLLALTKNIKGSQILNDQLRDVIRIFSVVQKMNFSLKFMVFQIEVLNEEIENFNDSLLVLLARQTVNKTDIKNSKYFNEDMSNLINQILGKYAIKRASLKIDAEYFLEDTKKQKSGPFINGDANVDWEIEEVDDLTEPAIPVCFYVFEADGSPSKIPYWVYCVPQRAYNQFRSKERNLQSLEKYKALGKASTAYKTLETSFPRYFFAVSDNGVMSEVQLFEVYEIRKDPQNHNMTHPYSFPIYLKNN
jgi:hypothetical protein